VASHARSLPPHHAGRIVGFRIPIARIEGKFKISQNRAPEERRNVQAAHTAGKPR